MSERESMAREEAIFHGALERPAGEREAYIELACAADHALRDRIVRLIRADAENLNAPGAPLVELVSERIGATATPGEDLAGQRVGAYRLIRPLGEGGMGTVWLGERDDEEFERRVAVKIIKRGMDSEQVLRRFRVERRALGVLEHPSIARLIDAAMAPDGRPALVMEYVDGQPLSDYCESASLTIPERLELFVRVCDAVEYAHQHLVVHRDLKPSNIFVTPDGDPKLIDFGIAKLLTPDTGSEQTLTGTHQRVLTPRYASPEQIRGDRVTTATDVFSLGVVLYELLTGRAPFDSPSGSRDEIGRLICEENPVRPSTAVTRSPTTSGGATDTPGPRIDPSRLRRVLEGDLDMIVLMALRKEPDRRYASVAQLAEDIRRYLSDMPVLARPDTLGYRTAKFVRRNRGAVVGVGSFLGVLVGAVVVLSWMYARTLDAEQAEFDQRQSAEAKFVEAERVATFLEEMLRSATPDRAEGQDPAVLREILDAAERRVGSELADQPAVRARIEHTLGASYRLIGDYDKAERHLAEAESLRRELKPRPEGLLGETIYERAALEMERSNIDEATRYAEQALETFRGLDAEPTRRLANAEDLLACTDLARGRFEDAQERFEISIGMFERLLPPDAPELLSSYGKRAVALAQLGHNDEAVGLLRGAAESVERSGAPVSSHTIGIKNNLAVLLRRTGKLEEALQIYDRVVADSNEHFGAGHRMALISRSNRGAVLHRLGRLDDAEREFREVLDAQREALGAEHEDTQTTAFNYAQLLSDMGRFAEAEPLYQQTIRVSESRHGRAHPQTAQIKGAYARAILRHAPERIDEARALLVEQLSVLGATLGEQHPATIRARGSLDSLDDPPHAEAHDPGASAP